VPLLLAHCQQALADHGGLLATLFMAGLIGGLTHCSGMCGPFVVAQLRGEPTHAGLLQRLRGNALIPYHLGRMTTYAGLGALAALLSQQIIGTALHQQLSAILLTLAGVVFILSAFPLLKGEHRLTLPFSGLTRYLAAVTKPLFANPRGVHGYGLGIMLGFLPCGLIFAALMAVATTGNMLTGALGMALFTLGTFPSLFMVGMGGAWLQRNWPRPTQALARGVMMINGCSLFFLAGTMIWN